MGLSCFTPSKLKSVTMLDSFIFDKRKKQISRQLPVVEEVEVRWSVELTITTKTLMLTNIDKDPVVAASASVACICCFGIVFARNDELITAL
jgi:hypothetical protein